MLVTLAVLLLLMVFIVKIFQAATGSLSAAQVYQEMDNQLRLLDSTIRSDLTGVTCRLTPGTYDPNTGKIQGTNDPKNNPGYFEYGENEFADLQGEDSDDYLRFTAKAPAGRPFTGRMWAPPAIRLSSMTPAQQQNYLASQPITITSEYAEIIYFVRNQNLYRRVLLIVPERQASIAKSVSVAGANNPWIYKDPLTGNNIPGLNFTPNGLGNLPLSWQGVNDISARPAARGTPTDAAGNPTNAVILNTLGDLTNRENRWAYQRFADDFYSIAAAGAGQDGLSDDLNGDNVPDYYPTLYPSVLGPVNNTGQLLYYPGLGGAPVWPPPFLGAMAFPYIYPGAYSRPQVMNNLQAGWIHSPEPQVAVGGGPVVYDGPNANEALAYLQNLNHNPMDLGDNLADPSSGLGGFQTWWGFPTWRENLSPYWTDPTWQVNANFNQPIGLGYQAGNALVGNPAQFLPSMSAGAGYRNNPQLYNDGLPGLINIDNNFFPLVGGATPLLWNLAWEDDLIMTGVRSFDVKVLDRAYNGYVDLGWGDDLRLYQPYNAIQAPPAAPPYLLSTPATMLWPPVLPTSNPPGLLYSVLRDTFAHEGRMPPLQNDHRLDAAYPNITYVDWTAGSFVPQYSLFPLYSSNVGDDNPAVFRLRRVWDSWSTAYTQAPANGVTPLNPVTGYFEGFPAGPNGGTPPVYPSYPPPYLAPLRGIQIQIKVTDPTNQRTKTLTIRQDFTDKL